ncbi:MAG: hypothetical protein GY727_12305 [Gammaproteobacteria bacterium]|nr:hypothetical protein [Gammaproteobacteria bacterium]
MKKPALMLVAGVLAFQLLIISGTLIGCFTLVKKDTNARRCTGKNIGEIMGQITTSAFALYAAEAHRQ